VIIAIYHASLPLVEGEVDSSVRPALCKPVKLPYCRDFDILGAPRFTRDPSKITCLSCLNKLKKQATSLDRGALQAEKDALLRKVGRALERVQEISALLEKIST